MGKPHLGMDLHQNMGMSLERLTTQQIRERITKVFSLGNSQPNIGQIVSYINSSAYCIFDLSRAYKDRRERFINCQGIYIFADPLMDLFLDSSLGEKFCKGVTHFYEVDDEARKNPGMIIRYRHRPVGETEDTEGPCMRPPADYSAVDNGKAARNIIIDRFGKVMGQLCEWEKRQMFDPSRRLTRDQEEEILWLHFCYVGLQDVCAPLFGTEVNHERKSKMDQLLRERRGEIVVCVPRDLMYDEE